ncbi:hypothetical protein VE02_05827 [Pseudogymnoascus sp. 03VT05]|nr:hypothetical protein VE02_05827 [Pseudogymnoascus sp. 03VT05]
MAGPHASIDPAYIKYNNMIINRHKYFRWTKRTAFISFAYVIAFPAFVGYWAFVTDGKLEFRGKRKGDTIVEF